MAYTAEHEISDGIERITYRPEQPVYKTPLVFQHGAWHGAWCWQYWQELFAEWGWISHAHSLPAHGQSTRKRPIRLCTMQLYRDTLKAQVERCAAPPVVIGHSMGGMVTQWYLSHVGDLPAAVLLASIPLYDYPWRYLFLNPVSMALAVIGFHGYPFVRSPKHVRQLLISDHALLSAEELHAKLDDESLIVPLQLSPLTWRPRKNVKTPVLVMAAGDDSLFSVEDEQSLVRHYAADFHLIPDTAHNAMIEPSYRESARALHDWLIAKGIQ